MRAAPCVLDALDESFDDDAETHETGRGRSRSRSRSRTGRREVLEDANQHESADVENGREESSARGNRRGGRPMTSLLLGAGAAGTFAFHPRRGE